MKVACIFAHPDDEAFGPGGTIAKLAQKHEVFLLSATNGEAGKDSQAGAKKKLGERRAKELKKSAKILGIKKIFFLGFEDGTLCNNLYHDLAAKIEKILKKIQPEIILTSEPRGGSGHIDHITVSMVSSFVFERLDFVHTILYSCISEERARANKGYFIYVPPGYKKSEIDLAVNTEDVWDQKLEAMKAHTSQIHDINRILERAKLFPKEEYFLIRSKNKFKIKI